MSSTELKIFTFTILTSFIIQLLLFQIVPDLDELERENIIEEMRDNIEPESGIISLLTSFFQNTAFNLLIFMIDFVNDIFGLDFIAYFEVVPIWVATFILLLNTIGMFSLIFYLVDRIWIG